MDTVNLPFWKWISRATFCRALARALCLVLLLNVMSSVLQAKAVLLVIDRTTIEATESLLKSQFEAWGYTVTTIQDGATQGSFDASVAASDVVYVPGSVDDYQLLYKLRSATVGVVTETPGLDTEFGYATSDGYTQTHTQILNTDNSHQVTSALSSGTVTIYSSSSTIAVNGNTLAAGMQHLAEQSFGQLGLGVIEAGGTLANTYGGNSTAAGRRVRLPWAGAFNISVLNSNGLSILENSLAWASSGNEALIAHWKFDEGTGTVLADSTGNGNNASFNTGSPAWVAGIRKGALEFDGSNDAATNSTFDPPGTSTVAFWFRGAGVPASLQRLFGITTRWEVTFKSDGTLGFDLGDGATFSSDIAFDVPDKWHHIVAITNASADTYSLYVDGKFVKSGSHAITDEPAGTLSFGTRTGQTNRFDGALDDLRIYNYELSVDEIADLYDLHGHWRLDESSGTTSADSSPQAHDGTYTNGPVQGGAGPYPGEVLNSVDFDGINDHVDLPDLESDFSQGFSAAFWIKPSSTPAAGSYFAFLDLGNGPDVDEVWLGWVKGVGFQLYMTDNYDGSALRTIEDNNDFKEDKWVHCVATIDSSGMATLYRDGVITKSGFYTSLPKSILRTQNFIGTSAAGDSFPGKIDDVRIYNRALLPEDVTELYGLMGNWSFDEGAGSQIADSSLKGNDAQFNVGSPAWIDGIYGKALEFDGTNAAQTDAHFAPPERGSVSLWFRSAGGAPASHECVFGVSPDFEICQDNTGLISFDLSVDGLLGGLTTTTPLTTANRWYHLVAQYDSATDSYEIYINGELHKSGVSSSDIQKQTKNFLSFGTRTGSTQRFTGAIDEFRIYNRWLSVAEINDLYGRIAFWKLDETSGLVATDSTEHEHHGAYRGAPALGEAGAYGATTGTSVELDGTTQDVATDEPLLDNLSAFSMLGWVHNDDSQHIQGFFGQNDLIELGIHYSSGQLHFWTALGGQVNTYNALPNGKWTHIAATGSGSELKIYLNGIEDVSGGHAPGSTYGTSNYKFMMGSSVSNPTGDYLGGKLDEVQIFDRAVTPEEIRAIYKNGRPAGVRIRKWVEVR